MGDEDVLAELRGYRDWPPTPALEKLAVEASPRGLLREPFNTAHTLAAQDSVSIAAGSATIAPTGVPPSAFSASDDWDATFYCHFERELRKALGLPIDFSSARRRLSQRGIGQAEAAGRLSRHRRSDVVTTKRRQW
jgi:hypothetical protein